MDQSIPYTEPAIVKANGIDLVYDIFGFNTSPPILLIMGLGAQMISWDDEFCKQLATRGFWVIRFDNRDVGLSTRFEEAGTLDIPELIQARALGKFIRTPYTLKDMADDAAGLLDALAIESAHIVGLSMGGMIAQMVAIYHPNRVRTLTSIMSSTSDPKLPPPKSEAISTLTAPAPSDLAGYVENYIKVSRVLSGPTFPLDEQRARKRARLKYDRGLCTDGTVRQFAAIIVSGSRREMLKSVAAPTLVMHGDADPLVPVECGMDTASAILGSELVIIEGLGHTFPLEVWPQVIDAIVRHTAEKCAGKGCQTARGS